MVTNKKEIMSLGFRGNNCNISEKVQVKYGVNIKNVIDTSR